MDEGRGGGAGRRLLAYEKRWMASLGLWVTRRRDGVGAGERALGYARAQAPMWYGLLFVCVVETVGATMLLAKIPVAHWVMLVLDVYTLALVLGLQAAAVTRPHVVGPGGLRVRNGALLDVWIPLERIASVRYDLRFPKTETAGRQTQEQDGVLELAVAAQTCVTVELTEPVTAVKLLGQRVQARTVRFYADEGRAAVAAVREAIAHREEGAGADGRSVITPV
ncbi:hypothetical protein [Streptomyces paromomycinus]|uniref:Uncharacterized protein n=1 Tax=Streptomyces paromomycinus TaxID=92743 RepID=A0A401WAD5_STREY|nr:hypothetical protein [Streptomyces paromomycinus]GCD46261.1 hypothetical protein GKJPGBOP_06008 [Streptomyces paromomycinus]